MRAMSLRLRHRRARGPTNARATVRQGRRPTPLPPSRPRCDPAQRKPHRSPHLTAARPRAPSASGSRRRRPLRRRARRAGREVSGERGCPKVATGPRGAWPVALASPEPESNERAEDRDDKRPTDTIRRRQHGSGLRTTPTLTAVRARVPWDMPQIAPVRLFALVGGSLRAGVVDGPAGIVDDGAAMGPRASTEVGFGAVVVVGSVGVVVGGSVVVVAAGAGVGCVSGEEDAAADDGSRSTQPG